MQRMNKRGQLTIFIIIAVVIVAVILIIFLYPRLPTIFGAELAPSSYLSSCIEKDAKTAISQLAEQGGQLNPEGFIVYQDKKIKYLCYAANNYETCKVQQPLIKQNFQDELSTILTPKINNCINNLKKEYESRRFSVSAQSAASSIEIIPHSINILITAPMTITKDTTQTFRDFNIKLDSEIYDLLLTASSIIEFESTFGDSETTLYLQYYPDLKIEKTQLSDGTTIYKLSNVITKESFTFASRSIPWPPGYGLENA